MGERAAAGKETHPVVESLMLYWHASVTRRLATQAQVSGEGSTGEADECQCVSALVTCLSTARGDGASTGSVGSAKERGSKSMRQAPHGTGTRVFLAARRARLRCEEEALAVSHTTAKARSSLAQHAAAGGRALAGGV